MRRPATAIFLGILLITLAALVAHGQVSTGPVSAAIGMPNARTLTTATAYQATDPGRAAMVEISIASTAALTVSGGTTNTAAVFVSSTNSVGTTGGTQVCTYNNANTGTLVIGVNTNAAQTAPCTFNLPVGCYFGIRVSSGSITIPAASDQSLG